MNSDTEGTSGVVASRVSGVRIRKYHRDAPVRNFSATEAESELREMVDGFEREGWVPMEREDVRVTAGI
jgi:hypothetical protein